jgi:hypothetical protein
MANLSDSKKSIATAGLLCLTATVGAIYFWWPRTAPPGQIPAVAPADPRVELPLDGYALPGLSGADLQKLKDGQAVEVRVGEGSVTIQSVKPAE